MRPNSVGDAAGGNECKVKSDMSDRVHSKQILRAKPARLSRELLERHYFGNSVSTESNSTDATERRDERESESGYDAEVPFLLDGQLSEDAALAELQQAEITAEQIAAISKNAVVAKSRKVAIAVVMHPRAPRHVSVPLVRRMFTFDLMKVSLAPTIATDIKRAAEDQILLRTDALPSGEKISLAKRASGRVAAALLQESDRRVIEPALDNRQLTEALVVQALMKPHAPEILPGIVSVHSKWSRRREVQTALQAIEKKSVELPKDKSSLEEERETPQEDS